MPWSKETENYAICQNIVFMKKRIDIRGLCRMHKIIPADGIAAKERNWYGQSYPHGKRRKGQYFCFIHQVIHIIHRFCVVERVCETMKNRTDVL